MDAKATLMFGYSMDYHNLVDKIANSSELAHNLNSTVVVVAVVYEAGYVA